MKLLGEKFIYYPIKYVLGITRQQGRLEKLNERNNPCLSISVSLLSFPGLHVPFKGFTEPLTIFKKHCRLVWGVFLNKFLLFIDIYRLSTYLAST